MSLPREVAKHPESGEPIVAGIGRFGPYVQHGKTYANIGRDEDILSIGGNRAIDLIVTKESGGGGSRFGRASDPGRTLGDHPQGGARIGQDRPLRPLCELGQDQRHPAQGNRPGKRDAGTGGRAARGQGEPALAAPAAAACSAIIREGGADHRARRSLRPLCQSRQGQRHPAEGNMSPEDVTLDEAIRLIEEKGGPVKERKRRRRRPAQKRPRPQRARRSRRRSSKTATRRLSPTRGRSRNRLWRQRRRRRKKPPPERSRGEISRPSDFSPPRFTDKQAPH